MKAVAWDKKKKKRKVAMGTVPEFAPFREGMRYPP